MTKAITRAARARAPRTACRMFEQGGIGHSLVCLFRPAGHAWGPGSDRRTYPVLPQSVTNAWRWEDGAMYGATVVLEGGGRLHVGDASREVKAGDVVLFTGIARGGIRWEESADFMETSVSMDGGIGARLQALGLWPSESRIRRVDTEAARVRFEGILHAIEVLSIPPAELLRRVIAVLGWLDQAGSVGAALENEDFAMRAGVLLRERSGPADRVEAIARELGYSATHFRRLFRRATGMSPSTYQLRERMARAAAMLQTQEVKGVAAALGYSDPFVFSRQFKAHVGLPPGVFRSGLRGIGRSAARVTSAA